MKDFYTEEFAGRETLRIKEKILETVEGLPDEMFLKTIEEEINSAEGLRSWIAQIYRKNRFRKQRLAFFRAGDFRASYYSELASIKFWEPQITKKFPELFMNTLEPLVQKLNNERKEFLESNMYNYDDTSKWLYPQKIILQDYGWEDDQTFWRKKDIKIRWLTICLEDQFDKTRPEDYDYNFI